MGLVSSRGPRSLGGPGAPNLTRPFRIAAPFDISKSKTNRVNCYLSVRCSGMEYVPARKLASRQAAPLPLLVDITLVGGGDASS